MAWEAFTYIPSVLAFQVEDPAWEAPSGLGLLDSTIFP